MAFGYCRQLARSSHRRWSRSGSKITSEVASAWNEHFGAYVGDLKPRSVEFTATELVVTLMDGRKIVTPLAWHARLLGAAAAQRAKYELMAMGIHWPLLDEDLSVAGLLKGQRAK